MTKTDYMESIASKAFDQATDKMYKERSCLYREKEQELYEIYREVERLFKRTMCIGEAEFKRLLAVFNLSVYLNDELNKLDGVYN